jgi:hypothetical protein
MQAAEFSFGRNDCAENVVSRLGCGKAMRNSLKLEP